MIITDCPVLLGASYYPELFPDSFRDLLLWAFNKHDTMNFFVERQHAYSTHGRRQTAEESDQIAAEMAAFLTENEVIFAPLPGSDAGLEDALSAILLRLNPFPLAEDVDPVPQDRPAEAFDHDTCAACERVYANCQCDPAGC